MSWEQRNGQSHAAGICLSSQVYFREGYPNKGWLQEGAGEHPALVFNIPCLLHCRLLWACYTSAFTGKKAWNYYSLKKPMYCCSLDLSRVQLSATPSTAGSSVPHYHLQFAHVHVRWVGDAIRLYCPLLLLPSSFPSIRVFSNESILHIRWPKYCSFSFSIGPSNEYSGFISFRIDWFDLLAVQRTLKSLL